MKGEVPETSFSGKGYFLTIGVKIKNLADVRSSSSSYELLRWKRRLNGLGLSPPSLPVKEILNYSGGNKKIP